MFLLFKNIDFIELSKSPNFHLTRSALFRLVSTVLITSKAKAIGSATERNYSLAVKRHSMSAAPASLVGELVACTCPFVKSPGIVSPLDLLNMQRTCSIGVALAWQYRMHREH